MRYCDGSSEAEDMDAKRFKSNIREAYKKIVLEPPARIVNQLSVSAWGLGLLGYHCFLQAVLQHCRVLFA